MLWKDKNHNNSQSRTLVSLDNTPWIKQVNLLLFVSVLTVSKLFNGIANCWLKDGADSNICSFAAYVFKEPVNMLKHSSLSEMRICINPARFSVKRKMIIRFLLIAMAHKIFAVAKETVQ